MSVPNFLTEISSKVLAAQLTIFERKIFTKITPSEIQAGGWSPKKAEDSPRISQLTNWFNKVCSFFRDISDVQLSYWIASETLKSDIKQRAKALSKWIKVAEVCC